jgi:hypothetical protein
VEVCVGDDTGPLVRVCAANVEPDDVMSAAKKAAKLAARVLANGPDDDDDSALQVSPGSGYASSYDHGDNESHHPKEKAVAERKWTISVGDKPMPDAEVAAIVAEATTDPAATAADPATAPAVAEQKEVAVGDATKAAETTATTDPKPLTEADVTRIVRDAIQESKAADKAARKAEKAAKAATQTDSTPAAAESTTKAAEGTALTESITPQQLDERLEAERKKWIAETRDALLKERGTPTRKGFRTDVRESDTQSGEDLWNNRKAIWAEAAPGLYAGTDLTALAPSTGGAQQ